MWGGGPGGQELCPAEGSPGQGGHMGRAGLPRLRGEGAPAGGVLPKGPRAPRGQDNNHWESAALPPGPRALPRRSWPRSGTGLGGPDREGGSPRRVCHIPVPVSAPASGVPGPGSQRGVPPMSCQQQHPLTSQKSTFSASPTPRTESESAMGPAICLPGPS